MVDCIVNGIPSLGKAREGSAGLQYSKGIRSEKPG